MCLIRRFEAHIVMAACAALLWWAASIYQECRCTIAPDAYDANAKFLDPKNRIYLGITPEQVALAIDGTSEAVVRP